MMDDIQSRALTFLGLCMRAGQLITGQDACVDAIRGGNAALALLDGGASSNTRKRIMDACHSHQVPLYQVSSDALGHAIGKAGRMAVTVQMGGMAQKLLEMLKDQPEL